MNSKTLDPNHNHTLWECGEAMSLFKDGIALPFSQRRPGERSRAGAEETEKGSGPI